ncbi:hypothetical protein B0H63DRAFT_167017 [Podospora didyma]|uniref:Uncharacterized protein n=1 Tax=Podospora didyma TaxID=330526 RepID=A0AAE0NV09_9PEZI|nr:hypothetical protein B0H63DRAFT_167017 [Podospora didyma]
MSGEATTGDKKRKAEERGGVAGRPIGPPRLGEQKQRLPAGRYMVTLHRAVTTGSSLPLGPLTKRREPPWLLPYACLRSARTVHRGSWLLPLAILAKYPVATAEYGTTIRERARGHDGGVSNLTSGSTGIEPFFLSMFRNEKLRSASMLVADRPPERRHDCPETLSTVSNRHNVWPSLELPQISQAKALRIKFALWIRKITTPYIGRSLSQARHWRRRWR